jgi:hypothetical protein
MKSAVLDPSRSVRTAWWLSANAAAACAFLAVASLWWIEPELADIPGASGGAGVLWFMTAVPIFVVSSVGNFCTFGWALLRRRSAGNWPFGLGAWLIPLLWLAVIIFDSSRHGA